MLSNTNDVHWAPGIGREFGPGGVFHRHYFSHEIGFTKSEAALGDLQVPPDRVLFLDDSARNGL